MSIVQDPCWLMISWGIILASILGIIIIQERGIPKKNQPGFNGMIEGFWTLLICFLFVWIPRMVRWHLIPLVLAYVAKKKLNNLCACFFNGKPLQSVWAVSGVQGFRLWKSVCHRFVAPRLACVLRSNISRRSMEKIPVLTSWALMAVLSSCWSTSWFPGSIDIVVNGIWIYFLTILSSRACAIDPLIRWTKPLGEGDD